MTKQKIQWLECQPNIEGFVRESSCLNFFLKKTDSGRYHLYYNETCIHSGTASGCRLIADNYSNL